MLGNLDMGLARVHTWNAFIVCTNEHRLSACFVNRVFFFNSVILLINYSCAQWLNCLSRGRGFPIAKPRCIL